MRLAVFVFSLILIFAPIYANALLFIPAITGAVVRTGAGQFIKVHSKKALVMAGVGYNAKIVYDWCKKTKKCDDIIENASELFGGGDEHQAYHNLLFVTNQGGYYEFNNPIDMCKHYMGNVYTQTYEINLDDHQVYNKGGKDYKAGDYVSCKGDIKFMPGYNFEMSFGFDGIYGNVIEKPKNDDKDTNDAKITKEQIQKIVQKMSDDDITYIINNYGDQINVEKYCSENACDELSDEFGNEVNNNKDRYDIDKINKQNCVVQNGKIVSCENAKKEKDEDKDKEEESKDDKEQEKEEGNEQKGDKIDCDASEFHKKVCDFIDWYQDDFEHDNTDTGVDVDDKSDDLPKHKDYIKFNAQCPPDKIINLSFRVNKSLNWTYQDLCHAMTQLKPFIIGFSMMTGLFIISGRRV